MLDEDDNLLADAFRELRDEHDGTSPQADVTLRRALLATRKQVRTRSITRFVLLPIAATFLASTVWAGMTGRLAAPLHAVSDAMHLSAATEPAPPPAPPAPVVAVAPPPAAPEPVAEPAPPVVEPPRPAIVAPPVVVASAPKPKETSEPATALYEAAHQAHFVDHDAPAALRAWDAYLAASPTGRFAPEARYNRALTLVRLGRTAEAVPELQHFADGAYGEYRRAEAHALLDALAADAAP